MRIKSVFSGSCTKWIKSKVIVNAMVLGSLQLRPTAFEPSFVCILQIIAYYSFCAWLPTFINRPVGHHYLTINWLIHNQCHHPGNLV